MAVIPKRLLVFVVEGTAAVRDYTPQLHQFLEPMIFQNQASHKAMLSDESFFKMVVYRQFHPPSSQTVEVYPRVGEFTSFVPFLLNNVELEGLSLGPSALIDGLLAALNIFQNFPLNLQFPNLELMPTPFTEPIEKYLVIIPYSDASSTSVFTESKDSPSLDLVIQSLINTGVHISYLSPRKIFPLFYLIEKHQPRPAEQVKVPGSDLYYSFKGLIHKPVGGQPSSSAMAHAQSGHPTGAGNTGMTMAINPSGVQFPSRPHN